jgi:EAL domain-containing protein (putative c-di-GMP-specific phosphodiesterase class I)/ActR/RegA family two-component response regulator
MEAWGLGAGAKELRTSVDVVRVQVSSAGVEAVDAEDVRQPSEKGRVLLVDDEATVSAVYARQLRRNGLIVEVAADAVVAAELCRQKAFDVVVSDISMPAMSGIDLLRSVREHDLDLPVVLLTGGPDIKDAIRAMEYGAFRYLVKPVPLQVLSDVVARAARLYQMAKVRREALQLVRDGGRQLGDRAGLESRFANALETLWMAYQPIVSWSARCVFAHEALVRTEEPTLRRPDHLLDAAERLGRLPDLGRAIRAKAAATMATMPVDGLLFVNLHTEDLADEQLFAATSPLSAFASRVVLEITERAALDRIEEPMRCMQRLRAMGYRIAIDDLGAGYAGLTSFAQLEPEVVKVDMSLVRGIDQSHTKQKLIRSIVELCRDLKIQIVAEGIETAAERNTLIRLGCDLCQGYLFARPEPPFPFVTF